MLLSGSLSAEFDLTHVCFIDVPGKKYETDFTRPFDERYAASNVHLVLFHLFYLSLNQLSYKIKKSSFWKTTLLVFNTTQTLSSAVLNQLTFLEKSRVITFFEDTVTCIVETFTGRTCTRNMLNYLTPQPMCREINVSRLGV